MNATPVPFLCPVFWFVFCCPPGLLLCFLLLSSPPLCSLSTPRSACHMQGFHTTSVMMQVGLPSLHFGIVAGVSVPRPPDMMYQLS